MLGINSWVKMKSETDLSIYKGVDSRQNIKRVDHSNSPGSKLTNLKVIDPEIQQITSPLGAPLQTDPRIDSKLSVQQSFQYTKKDFQKDHNILPVQEEDLDHDSMQAI